MWKAHHEEVEFVVVYVREAHPVDGEMPPAKGPGPLVEDPLTIDERREVAAVCRGTLDLSPLTMVVDDMQDSTAKAYAAHPERLYLVGKDGKVAFRSGPGPEGFKPDELERAMRRLLGLPELERREGPAGRRVR